MTKMTGNQFKSVRLKMGYTQTELSHLLGYSSYITIYFKESGRRRINKADEIILKTLKPKTK